MNDTIFQLPTEEIHFIRELPIFFAVFQIKKDHFSLLALSDCFSRLIGLDSKTIIKSYEENNRFYIHPDDYNNVLTLEKLTCYSPDLQFKSKFRIRTYKKDNEHLWSHGDYIWLRGDGKTKKLADGTLLIYVSYAEITREHKKHMQWLTEKRRSENLFHLILQTTKTAIFWKDEKGRFLGANKAFLEYYGFSSEDVLLGKTEEEMGWHTANPDPYQNDELKVLQDGFSTRRVPGTCLAHGESRHIVASKSPMYENGKIIGLVGSFEDVTSEFLQKQEILRLNTRLQKAFEVEKSLSEERLKIESLRDVYLATGYFNVTKDAEIAFHAGGSLTHPAKINLGALEEALEMEPGLNRQRPETLATLLSAAAQIPDAAQRKKFIRTCSHTGMLRLFADGIRDVLLEYRRYLQGKLLWVSTRVILLADPMTGDVLAFFYTRDIDEQKKSEQIVKLTLEKNCDAMALIDISKHTLKFRSISQEEKKHSHTWQKDAEINYEEFCRSWINNRVQTDEINPFPSEISIKTLTDKLDQAEEYSVAYDRRDKNGGIQRKLLQYCWLDETKTEILVMQTDITAAYTKEQERMNTMRDALSAAKKASNAKTDFVSRISHDIRTPISIGISMVDFALEDMDDKRKLRADLEKIKTSNTFLLSLINDVLDTSKIDSGIIELKPEPYPVPEFMANINNIIVPMCQQKKIHFSTEQALDPSLCIYVDKIRLNQIILNLLTNAVKYTPAGGAVNFSAESLLLPEGKIRFAFDVQDTGIGMSENFQKKNVRTVHPGYGQPRTAAPGQGHRVGPGHCPETHQPDGRTYGRGQRSRGRDGNSL